MVCSLGLFVFSFGDFGLLERSREFLQLLAVGCVVTASHNCAFRAALFTSVPWLLIIIFLFFQFSRLA
jgi:hypothetical protein